VSAVQAVLELHDLDLLLALGSDPAHRRRLERMGYVLDGAVALERERGRLGAHIDRRWLALYERSLGRYGRGLTGVRERVCQGCFVTLPTSAAPVSGEVLLHVCENCGRLLLWR